MNLIASYKQDFVANLKLAFPIMTGQLGQVLVNMTDNLMVGRLGADALAAVSVANAIFIMFMVLGMGISFALPPLVSEADGARLYQNISRYFKHSLVLNISFAIICAILILVSIPVLWHLGQDPDIIPLAIPYLEITAWSLIPLMVFQALRCYSDGMSDTLRPMYAIIIGNIVNIILNYGLIYGNLGLPEMGVSGAAMASLIARIVMIGLLLYFIRQRTRLWAHIAKARYLNYKKEIFKKLLFLGIPTSMQGFFEVTAFSGAALIMGMVGKDQQAAHQISINLASVTFLMCSGIGMAATIRVGNQLGKNDYTKMRDAGMSSIILVGMIMACMAILFIIFRHFLPTLYINDDIVINYASTLLILAAIFQIPDGVQVTALGALRGIQDVKVPMIITFISYWICGIPVSYIAAITLGYEHIGVWIGLIIGLSVSAVLLTHRFHKKSLLLMSK
ncbi:MAG: MATE family efflux transporter [Saprospiraceae bacterium]|nr:MATE family efflux transporter [Saprospiraceae bacterium]